MKWFITYDGQLCILIMMQKCNYLIFKDNIWSIFLEIIHSWIQTKIKTFFPKLSSILKISSFNHQKSIRVIRYFCLKIIRGHLKRNHNFDFSVNSQIVLQSWGRRKVKKSCKNYTHHNAQLVNLISVRTKFKVRQTIKTLHFCMTNIIVEEEE